VLSVTGLQPSFADLFYDGTEKARAFVRRMNDYGAKLMSDRPKRFGFFACLPVPDQDAVLKEIEYAFDTLKADGVMLFSNSGDKWWGDPVFRPMFQELNRRKSAVFIHPSIPKCCRNMVPGVGDTTVEFDFDTTRTVSSLLYNGVLAQMPDIKFIVNHSGAAVPVLSGRMKDQVRNNQGKSIPGGPQGAWEELRKLYFECAHATYPAPIAALTKFAPPTQLLFGTDFPVWPYDTTIDPFIETEAELSREIQHAMDRGNAERLFPRFKS
jgi:predicted TIM-barrel fold metal-dependent hydrolase